MPRPHCGGTVDNCWYRLQPGASGTELAIRRGSNRSCHTEAAVGYAGAEIACDAIDGMEKVMTVPVSAGCWTVWCRRQSRRHA
jgi:hypothetical protein